MTSSLNSAHTCRLWEVHMDLPLFHTDCSPTSATAEVNITQTEHKLKGFTAKNLASVCSYIHRNETLHSK